ncbi:MAG TPA: adenosine deaminase [Acidisarcina sp.]
MRRLCRVSVIANVFMFVVVLTALRAAGAPPAALERKVPAGPRLHTEAAIANAAARTEQAFERARKRGPAELRAFLFGMPKGADLHVHLSGAVYAETFLRDAGEDGTCVDIATLSFVRETEKKSSGTGTNQRCREGQTAAEKLNQHQYDALIDAFSMRSFVPSNGNSGHDHFFDTFEKFGGLNKSHVPEWIDEIVSRAAAQNEQYVELMNTPDFSAAAALALKIGFHSNFAEYRRLMLDQGLRGSIPAIRAEADDVEARRRQIEHCDGPAPRAACAVTVRYLFQVLRGLPRETVFAQTLLAFELASAEPRFVGLNFVMPEDGRTSMADYRLHMQMLDALHGFYPAVHISLHAGELAPGLVPPEGLTFHIRSAVEQGHAERIGHGVDVLYEDRPGQLLREMADRQVMVEINLTSNDVILGVKGDEHPLPTYLRFGVPVALSTDDEGVSRIDLTTEYVRAAMTYGLSYAQLKQMARTGIEHSFLPGADLWAASKAGQPVQACRAQIGNPTAAGNCAIFVKSSEKAQQQWELERRFHVFEAHF